MSEMKQGDLVSVLTPHGEFVGRLEKNDDTGVHLSNPKMMVSTKEGNMGFARGVCMTGEENPKSIIFIPIFIETSQIILEIFFPETLPSLPTAIVINLFLFIVFR